MLKLNSAVIRINALQAIEAHLQAEAKAKKAASGWTKNKNSSRPSDGTNGATERGSPSRRKTAEKIDL